MSEGQSPLEQFKIKYYTDVPEIFGANLNFSNSSMFMVFVITAVSLFLILSMKRRELVPGRWQSMAELSYELVANMIKDNVGNEGKPYFPIIFSLFMFVLFCNLFGMLPYSFTVTSHISITFALASLVFIGVTVIALVKHGVKFFGFFLPAGTPWWMAPLMYFIELFAYLARPVSLSIRLAANMMAGHTMLKVIAGFVVSLGITLGWAPLAMLVVLTGFEIFVAVLQAYIFTVLTCVYLNDALHLH
ncbi:MAG: F0F1 ATP synthase subunit A [Alphaproteobacteria bacterium CG11_big_fil_rev_8_21_14_0_20_39_49]|nr:MAG: F0F1 ATP synthase subunit A [Alphaproteobacteria bacterium CG11_big_fil_rev_8_21_14_0_20_39_49]